MELIFESPALKVYDDFAHHPTAIAITLAGLREQYPQDAILAVVEPASHTMRGGTHQGTLADSVMAADHVLWAEPAGVKWDMQNQLTADNAEVLPDVEAVLNRTLELHDDFQHVVIMSNGGFGGLHRRLVSALSST